MPQKRSRLPIPIRDVLRVDAQPPADPPPPATSIPVTAISGPPAQMAASQGSILVGYPFTKNVSLRNDGIGYGEVMIECYACFARGSRRLPGPDSLLLKESFQSVRTRTARTYPKIASPLDLQQLPSRDSIPPAAGSVQTVLVPRQNKVPLIAPEAAGGSPVKEYERASK